MLTLKIGIVTHISEKIKEEHRALTRVAAQHQVHPAPALLNLSL